MIEGREALVEILETTGVLKYGGIMHEIKILHKF